MRPTDQALTLPFETRRGIPARDGAMQVPARRGYRPGISLSQRVHRSEA